MNQSNNELAQVQLKAWRYTSDKPLSEPMMDQYIDACMRHSGWMGQQVGPELTDIFLKYFDSNFIEIYTIDNKSIASVCNLTRKDNEPYHELIDGPVHLRIGYVS